MKTRLDKLLESIDPAITQEQVSARIDDAINTFQIDIGIIKNWDTFKTVLTKFFQHTENKALRLKSFRSTDSDIDWGRCVRLLFKEYGENGEKAAFEIARTGAQGGLYRVLKAVARQMIDEYSGNEVQAKISHFWHSLSVNEQLATTDEYLAKYGLLLPSELTEGNATRIKANFIKVLEEHPQLIKRLKHIGRN